MHDGKHGQHLERMLNGKSEPTDIWALVHYGDPHHSTAPFAQLVMPRADWLQLGAQIDAMSVAEQAPDPHPLDRRRHEPSRIEKSGHQ